MEGGAMRGMFTCGVTDVFLEQNIRFDGAVGISAGAAFGCNFKSEQIGRAIRYNKAYGRDPRYCGLRSLLKTGDLYGADFCYHVIPEVLDPFDQKRFAENPMEFYIGATDVLTGKPLFHRCSDGGAEDVAWMQASASMPAVSRIVKIGDLQLLDGGISDSIPFAWMEQQGYQRNVVILTQPEGYRKKKSPALPLMRIVLRKYPAVVQSMAVRHEMYNRELDDLKQREQDGAALVIRPPEPLHIRRTESNPDELERVYQTGRSVAVKRLAEIRSFLAESESQI